MIYVVLMTQKMTANSPFQKLHLLKDTARLELIPFKAFGLIPPFRGDGQKH